MPVNNQRPASNPPASPRNHAKYTNKDGSKFITVPKGAANPTAAPPSSDPSQASPLTTPTPSDTAAHPNLDNEPAPAVNRKKQKRRQKAAAKAAAEQAANGHHASVPQTDEMPEPARSTKRESRGDYSEGTNGPLSSTAQMIGGSPPEARAGTKKGKKKKKKGGASADEPAPPAQDPETLSHDQALAHRGPGISRDKIWSTSNHEERERIKEFWLGLGEDERKSLVKVEKDAVLKKMKEQQKHTCSCTVCGRKRTAIEEELEGLYDAYYLELEQFANQGEGPPMLAPPPRAYPPTRPLRPLPTSTYAGQPPARGRIVEHVDDADDDELEEIYSDDEVDDEDYSDEPPEDYDEAHERDVADFLTFGNSLQVKGTQLLESFLNRYGNMDLGGILTVADDLLKNDGKRFIEMMEQLAERRMAREEDAREHVSRGGYGHPNGAYSSPHGHPQPDDEEYEDEEDEEEEYEDSQEDEEYEDEEVYSNPSVTMMPPGHHAECCCQDQMTEEQRMEEGRRMFQIFAARMFEQRVLSAYKEKVAKERQQKLLEELEEESRMVDEQKAKKAKNAQKKKDKAAQKKQALAEEKARRDAEKLAEEAARLEAEQRKAAEQRQKAEEKRKAREAQKKAEEETRLKKEAERQRKIHEQREKQAEQERKAREAREREKKAKEEQRLREKDAREQKDREAQERKEKQERDKREKEARAAKAQKEAQEAREAKEKAKEEKAMRLQPSSAQPAQAQAQAPKRGSASSAPLTTVLPQHPPNPAQLVSPKIPFTTPAIPKAPTPMRQRTVSQQQDPRNNGFSTGSQTASHSASTSSQNASPHPVTPGRSSPGPGEQTRKSSAGTPGALHGLQNSSSPDGHTNFPPMPPMGMMPPPGLAHHLPPPGFPSRMPQDPMLPPGFRAGPSMMGPPPGMNGPPGRGFPPGPIPPPGFPGHGDSFGMGGYSLPKDIPPVPQHVRQGSAGYEGSPGLTPAQPIGRPAPIGRPGSNFQGRPHDHHDAETKQLGSSALVADDDDDTPQVNPGSFRSNQPPGPGTSFGASPFLEAAFPMAVPHTPWGPSSLTNNPFPVPGFGAAAAAWNNAGPSGPPGFHVGSPSSGLPPFRPAAQPRHIAVRLMLCQACRELSHSANANRDGFIDVGSIKAQVDLLSGDSGVSVQDLLDLCDTEGSPSNGGGTFEVRHSDADGGKDMIRWTADQHNGLNPHHRAVGAPGEIGSPLVSQASVRGV